MGIHDVLNRYQFINKEFHSRNKYPNGESAIDVGTAVHREIHYIATHNGELPPTIHLQTLYFIVALSRKGWKMIDAEVNLEDPRLSYVTKIDVLARDQGTGKTIVIEVKTTSSTWNEAQKELQNIERQPTYALPESSPWSSRKEFKIDTPVSRALAQVTLEYHALKSSGRSNLVPFVVYLFNDITFERQKILKNEDDPEYPVRFFYPAEDALTETFYHTLINLFRPASF